ncbi:VanZ family protein [Brochothrix thermosphacta]|uniref:VanZ family protein n=1 Tax=Brochothrix thermosphacta TaxID=2756 RepID=UPI00265D374B|nr:VanZ family protein [Brochothrix thermosphacta]WKK67989.1 VanZ family protein [Brochothrix thermosphacta]
MNKRLLLVFITVFIGLFFIMLWIYGHLLFDRLLSYVPQEYMWVIESEVFSLLFLILTALYITLLCYQIYQKKLSKVFFYVSMTLYFPLLIFLLFFKSIGVQGYSFNPLAFIVDILDGQAFEVFANIIFFIPLGIILSLFKVSSKKAALFSVLFIVVVESSQYIFELGFFDVADIITNLLGITIGYVFFKKIKL